MRIKFLKQFSSVKHKGVNLHTSKLNVLRNNEFILSEKILFMHKIYYAFIFRLPLRLISIKLSLSKVIVNCPNRIILVIVPIKIS